MPVLHIVYFKHPTVNSSTTMNMHKPHYMMPLPEPHNLHKKFPKFLRCKWLKQLSPC